MKTLQIYVQNWRLVSRKSDIATLVAAFSERFKTAVRGTVACRVDTIEYRPNYATPMSYDEVLSREAWSLWSSVILKVHGFNDSPEELEKLLEKELTCFVHVVDLDAESSVDENRPDER